MFQYTAVLVNLLPPLFQALLYKFSCSKPCFGGRGLSQALVLTWPADAIRALMLQLPLDAAHSSLAFYLFLKHTNLIISPISSHK